MLDWLIIGGGVIGTTLANYLICAYNAPVASVRVLDPALEPLARWSRLTAATGMRYLRSPHVHHIDINPLSLRDFGKTQGTDALGGYITPYDRPAYALFQAHVAHVIRERGLAETRLRGRAEFIMSTRGGYRVETDNGVLRTRRLVLAIGRTALHEPEWAASLQAAGAPVQHIFAPGFSLESIAPNERVLVVGGGVTAGQIALTLAAQQANPPAIVMRHAIRQADFDSSPCWLGPRCKEIFQRAQTPAYRRELIQTARNRGTMPTDVTRDLRAAVREWTLRHVEGDIAKVLWRDSELQLTLQDGQDITADRLLLATGFVKDRPGGPWIDELIDWFGLPVAACGYPVIDARLQWARGLHVSGPLAELELGPPAANIVGGRLAAERLRPLLS